MSDFFNDDNLIEQNPSQDGLKETEKKALKSKKLWTKIVAALLSVALLSFGTFAVIKFIPEKEENSSQKEIETIDVLDLDTDKISSVSITNQNGTYTLKSEISKSDTEDGEDSKTWYVEGVNKNLIDPYLVSAKVSSASMISAIREITEKSEKDCGLENPKIYAEITMDDNSKTAVYLGGDSPDNTGCYLKLSTSDKIYLVENSVKQDLIFDKLDFALADNIPALDSSEFDGYYTDGTLSKFDMLTISGDRYKNPVVVTENTDKSFSEYIPYKVVSPQEHYADNIDKIIELFQNGVTASGAYSYETDKNALKKFGLNSPDFTIKMKLGAKTVYQSYKIQNDGSYAAVSSVGNLIYKVEAENIPDILSGDPTKFYSSVICLFNIDKLKSFGITAENKTYDFAIKKKPDSDTSEDRYDITLKDKKIDCSSFQNLYKYVLTFGCYDYSVGKTDKSDTVRLTFNLSDDKPVYVDFEKSSDTKYQYSINGKPIGKIQSSKIDKLIRYTKKLANGEKIPDIS
ncbi:MAG: DUF4340 domain-containing protein [Clostridia bacterium]|nr:DUF4340 domain-containing protein [Clostridia bacterium]